MEKKIKSIRGMNDYISTNIQFWQKVENILKRILASYSFSEIRTPIVEQSSLFLRAIGQVTDVIEKEMYSFDDRDGNSISLRPENTAGCVRAGIEHGFLHNQQQRLWYLGPMFRYERPQKGRYRQFHQLGVEVFGLSGPDIDAELITMTARWWRELRIYNHLRLQLNSIGTLAVRIKYRQALINFLQPYEDKLDEDSKRRLFNNPLRILDSKNPFIKTLLNDAPLITDYLDENSKHHLNGLCQILDSVGIKYDINQRLVRGLDYYNNTVFEWVTNVLGAQGTVCAGGRYDRLVEQLGGRATPAVGFAMGMERIVLLLRLIHPEFVIENSVVDAYLISCSKTCRHAMLVLAEKIRDQLPSLKLMTHHGGGDIKKQLSKADKYRAKIALILGEDEYSANQVTIKDLRNGNQQIISQRNIAVYLNKLLG